MTMQWLNKLFAAVHYTSEVDKLLMHLNATNSYNTPGKAIKKAYHESLKKKRDKISEQTTVEPF